MGSSLEKNSWLWVTQDAVAAQALSQDLFCPTRDIFQARLDKMTTEFLNKRNLSEDVIYIIVAVAGEIGNNSFDHNLGNWPDIAGIFFGFNPLSNSVVLADRGQGILATLQKVKPSLKNDVQAVTTAFKEKLSGRAPENRGNGLKFVRQTVQDQKLHLTFFSGAARAELNQTLTVTENSENIKGCLAILQFESTM